MATIKPFAALRPKPALAAQICELPYDVMSSGEAREIAAGNPSSFLHVSRPEIDFPPGTDSYAPDVYARGKQNFQELISRGALVQDDRPNFYLYRQMMGDHLQTGLVAVASCEEYLQGIVKKHELTRVDKEDDRVRHMETLNAQTGPAWLFYRSATKLDEFVAKKTSGAPEIDFTAKDGVRHSSWTISDEQEIEFIQNQVGQIPFLYLADGHHRSAAAARVFQSRQGAGESGEFLAVIFPQHQMQILPYNRVLKDLSGWTPEQLLEILGVVFAFNPDVTPTPSGKHGFGLYLQGRWHSPVFRKKFLQATHPIEKLDVTLLQKNVMAPIFGINDPRTSERIHFVGGIRGTAELEKLVNSGEYACAFSMFPTGIEDLTAVADANEIMPPKSTWFEPKLRDGMFCHMI